MKLERLRQKISLTKNICMKLISICSSINKKVGDKAKTTFEKFRSLARVILQGENLPRYLHQYRNSLKSTITRISSLISRLQKYCVPIGYAVIFNLFGYKIKVFEKISDFNPQIKTVCSQIKSVCNSYIRNASSALANLR